MAAEIWNISLHMYSTKFKYRPSKIVHRDEWMVFAYMEA